MTTYTELKLTYTNFFSFFFRILVNTDLGFHTGHEDHFCLGLPRGYSYRALYIGHVLACSTRIQQSLERQPR